MCLDDVQAHHRFQTSCSLAPKVQNANSSHCEARISLPFSQGFFPGVVLGKLYQKSFHSYMPGIFPVVNEESSVCKRCGRFCNLLGIQEHQSKQCKTSFHQHIVQKNLACFFVP